MKNLVFFLFIANLLLSSCNDNIFDNLETGTVNKNIPTSSLLKWKEHLEYAQRNKNTKLEAGSNEVSLIKYTYKGKIHTKKQISDLLKQLFSDDTNVVTYIDSVNYEIIPLKTFRHKAKKINCDNPEKNLRNQLDTVIKLGMDVIELEWSYKGHIIYSTAVASEEKGILYDHIGHMITTTHNDSPNEEILIEYQRMKTRSEGSGDGSSTKEVFFELANNGGKNIYGNYVWIYHIRRSSFFNSKGVLVSRSNIATHDNAIGWSCDARLETISGTIDESKYDEFAWGYSYGRNIDATLSWNGTEFTIPSGSKGSSGSLVHRR